MRYRRGRVLLGATAGLILGCSRDATDIHVRAAFDLKCPKEKLEVVKLGERTRGVRGCGNQATYIYSGGEWVMDADGQGKAPASGPPR